MTNPLITLQFTRLSLDFYAWSEEPVTDERGDVAAFCDSTDAWLPLICTMNVTVATEAVRRLFQYDHAGLDAAVRSTNRDWTGASWPGRI